MVLAREYPLYPNLTIIHKIVKIRINIFEYNMFESAKISVILLDELDKPIENRLMTIDASNGFNDWNNDDTFIVKWVKDKLQH